MWRLPAVILALLLTTPACVGPFAGQSPQAQATPGSTAQKPGAQGPAKVVTVAPVTQGQLRLSLQFSGTIEASSQVNIAPQVSGRLDKLVVDVGGQVKTGDAIAVLQQDTYRLAVQQAQANLSAAQAKLETSLAGGRAETVASAQAALDAAQTKLAQLRNPSPSDLQAAQSAVDTAAANLASAQAKLDQVKAGATEADLAAAKTAADQARDTVASAEAKLNAVKNPFTEADWAAALGAVDTARANLRAAQSKLQQVKAGTLPADLAAQQAAVDLAYANLLKAQDALEAWQNGNAKTSGVTSNSEAVQAVQAAQDAYNAAVAKLQQLAAGPLPADLQAALSAADAAQAQYNSAVGKVNTLKAGPLGTDVAQAQNAVDAARAGLTAAQAKYDQLKAGPQDADVVAAQSVADTTNAALASAQARLSQLQNPTSYDIRLAQDAIRQAEQNVALQQQPFTPQDIQAARATVEQAQAAVDSAKVQLAQTTLVAPFDGVITQKLVSPGAVVSPSTPVVTLSSNELDIPVSFEESRLSMLKPGLSASITVAAYPGQTFPGRVDSIYPSADPKSHTFIMKVVPDDSGGKLRAGMFANVTVATEPRENVLMVPQSAVTRVNGKDVVFVVADGKAQARSVVLGATSEGNVEIVSGLTLGDTVVVSGNAGLNDGDPVRAQNAP